MMELGVSAFIAFLAWSIFIGVISGVAGRMLGKLMRPKRRLPSPPMSADEMERLARAFDTFRNNRRG